MVAVPTGGPVGVAAGVLEEVEGAGVVVVADKAAAVELAVTGLPSVVLHPVAPSATKTTASTTPVAARFAILGAYVG